MLPFFVIRSGASDLVFAADQITALLPVDSKSTYICAGAKKITAASADECGDCESLAAMLMAAGQTLVSLPRRGKNAQGEILVQPQPHAYIHPAEIAFLTYAEPDASGQRVVMIGTRAQRIATFMTLDEINAVIKQCSAQAKPNFVFFDAQDAWARCSDPAGLYIAGSAVSEVCVDAGGLGINVTFFERNDVLDVRIDPPSGKRLDEQEYADKRDGVARQIEQSTQGLRHIPHSRRFCAVTPAHVTGVLVPDTAVYPNGSHPYTLHLIRGEDQLILEFNSTTTRRSALDVLMAKPAVTAAKKPSPHR